MMEMTVTVGDKQEQRRVTRIDIEVAPFPRLYPAISMGERAYFTVTGECIIVQGVQNGGAA